MRNLALAAVAGLALTGAAQADIYNDEIFDTFTGAGGGILDIVSVEVTNDLTNINFTIELLGDVEATNWGKYMVGIHTGPGGDTAGNGWNRPISMPIGMNIWLGGWVDGSNGLENRQFNGSAWNLAAATYGPNAGTLSASKSGNLVTYSVSLASLGLSFGQTIQFDVFSSGGGGGDGAIDSLSNPNQSVGDWGTPYSAQLLNSYTVVPTPGVAALGLVGLAAAGRRRR